jgi:hypothetical protein
MMKYKSSSSDSFAALILIIFIFLIFVIIGAFCWPYAINSWLAYFHKPVRIIWWEGALLACVPYVGRFSSVVAVLTWLAMMFVK